MSANLSFYLNDEVSQKQDDSSPIPQNVIEYWARQFGREFGAQRISLFGSYARHEATAASDVDILLDKGQIRGMAVLDFQDALSNKLNRKVDVVTTAGASQGFLKKIQKDVIVLYEAD